MHPERDIQLLRHKVLEMAVQVRRAAQDAVRALERRDAVLAEQVIDGDVAVDDLDCEIDDMCLRLLALAQPWARDLRFIVTVVRACVHIERMGDEAVNIARAARELSRRPPLPGNFSPALAALEEQARLSLALLERAVQAFCDAEAVPAQAVREQEPLCERLETEVITHIIEALDNPEGRGAVSAVQYLNSARALMRIGKLSCNLAEGVLFIVDGKDMRHSALACPL